MRNLIEETIESISRNKLRTCLTGFAVSWGIFIIIVLLGAGHGLLNAFIQSTGIITTNTMMVGGGQTSKPYDGFQEGRKIQMDEMDIDLTKGDLFTQNIDEVIATSGLQVQISKENHHFNGYLEGNFPKRAGLDKFTLLCGRFINDKDIDDRRKILVIPDDVAERLIPDGNTPSDLLGKKIKVDNIIFTVVGISKSDQMSDGNVIYAPFTTVRDVFNKGKFIDNITFSFHGLTTENENDNFEKIYRAAVNRLHRAAPDDNGAIWLWNRFTQNLQMVKVRNILNIALWIIGVFTLLSGIVGVSNIMLITVKERFHEFGIRKAIGASPWSITKLIVGESVMITGVFGYLGMFFGILGCEIMDITLGHQSMDVMGVNVALLINPTVGIDVAIEATLVLIIAGVLAGLVPAGRAARIRPVESLNAE